MTKKLEEALNVQIAAELWSANLYLSMSFYFKREGLDGAAHWLKIQSNEEKEHACKMADFMLTRGGIPKLDKIDVVPQDWESPLKAFEGVYEHERNITKFISELLAQAKEEKDYLTEDFFWQFIREQAEEEATAHDILEKLRKHGDTSLFFIDAELGKRSTKEK